MATPAPHGDGRCLQQIVLVLGGLCAFSLSPVLAQIELRDVTRQTGITFRHTDGSSGRHYIVETVSAGLATFDYDGDGQIDIYFLNGRPLRGTKVDGPLPRHALYRNLGRWQFADVTRQAGADGGDKYGLGVAVADYDNDSHPDIYITNFGPNTLYHNRGDGTFHDVAEQAGVAGPKAAGAGACFLDADGDGRLDLFVANYLQSCYENHATVTTRGYPVYPGPTHFPPMPANFFHNNGHGVFNDRSATSGIAARAGWGMGIVAADYDNDGDTDVFVANDLCENFLWQNDGRGSFREVGLAAGVAYDINGDEQGSMGVDCGDFNNDGLLDFYQTSYQGQLALLYKNLGRGVFEDATLPTGAGAGTLPHVTWGCTLVDFDNDGHRDIFVACGHLQDNIDRFDDTTSYYARNILLRNTGDGRFVNVSDQAGDGMQVKLSSRGAAFDDLDNDGDIDVVVLNSRREPTILRNMLRENGSKHHWLEIQLRGTKSNRDGVGAHVKVIAGDLSQIDEVHSGRGYQSHYGNRLHFGLGQHERIDRIEVRWLGGTVDVLENVSPDRLLTITEGTALTAVRPAGIQ